MVAVEKTAAIVTSRDAAIASPGEGALAEIRRAPSRLDDLLPEHQPAWAELWGRFGLEVSRLDG